MRNTSLTKPKTILTVITVKIIASFLFFILFIILINNGVNNLLLKKTLEIEILSPRQSDDWQVFYDLGRGYKENDSSHTQVTKDKGTERITFDLYYLVIKALRIDPGTRAGDLFIKSITFKVGNSSHMWTAKQIADEFQAVASDKGVQGE